MIQELRASLRQSTSQVSEGGSLQGTVVNGKCKSKQVVYSMARGTHAVVLYLEYSLLGSSPEHNDAIRILSVEEGMPPRSISSSFLRLMP